MSHTQTITLSYSPWAPTVHLLSQHGDGLSTTENKNKTTNIWLFFSHRASWQSQWGKKKDSKKEKMKLGDPCSVSADFQSSSGNFTDKAASNRAEGLFNEITSCSFYMEWQHTLMTLWHRATDLFWQYFVASLLHLLCPIFLKKFYIPLSILFSAFAHLSTLYVGPLCVLSPQHVTGRKKSRDWTEINNSLAQTDYELHTCEDISSLILILELNYVCSCRLGGSDLDATGWCMNYCNEQYLSSYFFPLPQCFLSLLSLSSWFFSVCRNNLASW